MRIRFTLSVRSQFLAALVYIRRDDPAAAARFRRRAEITFKRLQRFPGSGRVLPEFPELAYREVLVRRYCFFYRTEGGTVWVVAVWHGAQIPREPMGCGV